MSDLATRLPKPVATYLAAEKAKDVEMLTLCFAETARVRDENHEYRGIDAITAWKREADVKYKYVLELLDGSVDGQSVKVGVRLTGDFPGSPVELEYAFTLENDRITDLVIG